jgi:valyl-tRNA synthetase
MSKSVGNVIGAEEAIAKYGAEILRLWVASKDYTDFMASRGFGVIYASSEEFGKFMAKSDAELGATMKAVGLVK